MLDTNLHKIQIRQNRCGWSHENLSSRCFVAATALLLNCRSFAFFSPPKQNSEFQFRLTKDDGGGFGSPDFSQRVRLIVKRNLLFYFLLPLSAHSTLISYHFPSIFHLNRFLIKTERAYKEPNWSERAINGEIRDSSAHIAEKNPEKNPQ